MNYLRSMPFTIVFIDKKGNTFEDSCRDLNAYIERHPFIIPRLHQPKFATKILEIAAHQSGMRVVQRPADTHIRHPLTYVIRKSLFKNDEAMWAFINDPKNLDTVR